MNAWIDSINDFSIGWAAWMWRATWQAAIVIAVAWLLTLVLKRWSPRLRSWIWRLAYVKLLLLLVWTTPVTLAVLPPQSQESVVASRDREEAVGSVASRDREEAVGSGFGVQASAHRPTVSVGSQESSVGSQEPGVSDQGSVSNIPHSPFPAPHSPDSPLHPLTSSISLRSYLLLLWSCGAIAVITWLALEIWKAARLYRSVQLIDRPELTDLVAVVRRRLGLRCGVQLGGSHLAAGPMLVKFIRPLIVFPEGLLHSPSPQPLRQGSGQASPVEGEGAMLLTRSQVGTPVTNVPGSPLLNPEPRTLNPSSPLSDNDIRLVLAHELAHVKRHDLAWNALAAAVHCVLYFHPFVWFAHRFARQEQEMACDEVAVTHLDVSPHDYGLMLIKIVQKLRQTFRFVPMTLGMSGSYHTLFRRIEAMKHTKKLTRRQIVLSGFATAMLAALALVPWRVVAQDGKPARDPLNPALSPKEREQAATAEKPAVENAAKEKPSAEQMLIGTWRTGKSGGKLVIRKDGTFYAFAPDGSAAGMPGGVAAPGNPFGGGVPPGVVVYGGGVPNGTNGNQGRWSARGDRLMLIDSSANGGQQERLQYKIARLDDTFLRIYPIDDQRQEHPEATSFYLRVKEVPTLEQLGDRLPAKLLHIAEVAGLDGEDALALADWYKADGHDKLPWDVVERIEAFRKESANYKALYKLSDDEDKAYAALMRLAGGRYSTACALAEQGLLAPDEQNALKKIKQVQEEFTSLLQAVNDELGPAYGGTNNFGAAVGMVNQMIRSADEGGNANPAYGLLRANPVYGPGGSDPFAGQATGAPPAPNPAERARVEALLKLRTYLQTLWSVMMPFAC